MLAPTRAPICTKCQTEVVVWAAKVMRGPLGEWLANLPPEMNQVKRGDPLPVKIVTESMD